MKHKLPGGLLRPLKKHWSAIDRVVTAEMKKLGETFGDTALSGVDIKKDRLGIGLWGVVYPTTSPRWIVKLSMDPTEGPITAAIIGDPKLRSHPGSAYFANIWRLKEKAKRGRKAYTVYVILRENIDPRARIAEDKISAAEDKREDDLMDLRDAAEELNTGIITDDDELISSAAKDYGRITSKLERSAVSRNMASFMFEFLDRSEGVLEDAHLGNIGFRLHDLEGLNLSPAIKKTHQPSSKSWVLFDPGHSDVAAHGRIPLLKNPVEP